MKNQANIAAAHSTPTAFAVATLAQAKERKRHKRRADARLDYGKGREQRHCADEATEGAPRCPAELVAVDDRVHREHEGGGDRQRARDVEPARRGPSATARQKPE